MQPEFSPDVSSGHAESEYQDVPGWRKSARLLRNEANTLRGFLRNDENLKRVTTMTYKDYQHLLAVSNGRIFIVGHVKNEPSNMIIPLGELTAVHIKTGLLLGEIDLTTAETTHTLRSGSRDVQEISKMICDLALSRTSEGSALRCEPRLKGRKEKPFSAFKLLGIATGVFILCGTLLHFVPWLGVISIVVTISYCLLALLLRHRYNPRLSKAGVAYRALGGLAAVSALVLSLMPETTSLSIDGHSAHDTFITYSGASKEYVANVIASNIYSIAKEHPEVDNISVNVTMKLIGVTDEYGNPVEGTLDMGNITVGPEEVAEIRKYADFFYYYDRNKLRQANYLFKLTRLTGSQLLK